MTAQLRGAKTNWERMMRVGFAASALALGIATGCGAKSDDSGGDATTNPDGIRNGSDNTPSNDAGSTTPDATQPPPSDTTDPPPDTPDPPDFDAGPAVVKCSPIVEGKSTVSVNGKNRTFFVQLPNDTSKMALLFLWHGWNQDPQKFANEIVYDVPSGKWVRFDPNGFKMPLMIVTPADTGLLPPFGLDWDIVNGAKDFPYFEAMLQCINAQYSIEKKRVYSFGFSAGAVFTNLLASQYPHLFAATIAESGMWYNDKPEQADVQFGFIMSWKWPNLNSSDRGNVLLTHGGDGSNGSGRDFATVADLESANKKAVPFLTSNGRTVVECSHTFGHTLDPDLTQSMYYDYMWSHSLGGSPLTQLVPSFPTPEHKVGATSCVFHAAQ